MASAHTECRRSLRIALTLILSIFILIISAELSTQPILTSIKLLSRDVVLM